MIHCNRFVTFAATMMVAIVAVMLAAQTTETFTVTPCAASATDCVDYWGEGRTR